MNKTLHQRLWSVAKVSLAIVLFFGGSQVASAAAAGLSADHIVRNTAVVNYADASGLDQAAVTSFVDITINLVAASPTVAFNTAESTVGLDTLSINQSVTLAYEIFSNANGLDSYTFTVDNFVDSGGFLPTSFGGTVINLAATVASATVGSTFTGDAPTGASGTAIVVAADGVGNDSALNGFVVGDFVKVGVAFCIVHHITEPGALLADVVNATSTLYVDNCKVDFSSTGPSGADQASGSLGIGDSVGQIRMAFLTVTPTAAGTLSFDVVVNDTADLGVSAATISDSITALATDLRIRKFVRNITNSANNPNDDCSTDSVTGGCLLAGLTYFADGVSANTGEQLQYAILLYNNGGLTTEILVTDVDVAFTTYDPDSTDLLAKSGSVSSATDCATAAVDTICTVTGTFVPSANDDDDTTGDGFVFYDSGAGVLTVAAGHDGAVGAEDALVTETVGGQIYAGEASVVIFSVTID
jgi:hypothetical protein